MNNLKYATLDKDEILEKIFSFLVEQGLENTSIREISRQTGIVQGSLYYWFPDKTTIICEATKHGLIKITDAIFGYVFETVNDLPKFFSECVEKISKYRKELRFVYQMVSSPVYGAKMRSDGKYFKAKYDKYAVKLAEHLKCPLETVKPIVYLFVSAICDYAVWEDEDNVQTELDFLYSILPKIMDIDTGEK